jgi:hypothetical protein
VCEEAAVLVAVKAAWLFDGAVLFVYDVELLMFRRTSAAPLVVSRIPP